MPDIERVDEKKIDTVFLKRFRICCREHKNRLKQR